MKNSIRAATECDDAVIFNYSFCCGEESCASLLGNVREICILIVLERYPTQGGCSFTHEEMSSFPSQLDQWVCQPFARTLVKCFLSIRFTTIRDSHPTLFLPSSEWIANLRTQCLCSPAARNVHLHLCHTLTFRERCIEPDAPLCHSARELFPQPQTKRPLPQRHPPAVELLLLLGHGKIDRAREHGLLTLFRFEDPAAPLPISSRWDPP